MPQAKLPDVNAGLVRYRSLAIEAYDNNQHDKARMALGSIVALLPKEFKIHVDTDEYLKRIQEQSLIVCPNCKHENMAHQVKRWSLKLYGMDRLVQRKDKVELWNCLKCKKENRLDQSKKIRASPEKPYYTGWIPNPPQKRIGITDRMSFPTEFRNWFEIAIHEIESKIGIYRAEYLAQNPDEKDTFGNDET